ncbi:MAG: hypothetical protein ACK559_07620, partial [bacterium]
MHQRIASSINFSNPAPRRPRPLTPSLQPLRQISRYRVSIHGCGPRDDRADVKFKPAVCSASNATF